MYESCRLLLKVRDYTMQYDYSKIGLKTLGYFGLISHVAIFINGFALCIAFLVVYMDTTK